MAARVSGETGGAVWASVQVGMRTAVEEGNGETHGGTVSQGPGTWDYRLWVREAEGGGIQVEGEADGFDYEVVVFALREAGDGNGADDPGSSDVDGEASAVRGVIGVGESVALGELAALLFEEQADGVGGPVEAGYYVDFALDPPLAVGGGSSERGIEELLVGLAEAAYVDDDALVAGESEVAEGEAEMPGGVVVEGGEAEFGFLSGDEG